MSEFVRGSVLALVFAAAVAPTAGGQLVDEHHNVSVAQANQTASVDLVVTEKPNASLAAEAHGEWIDREANASILEDVPSIPSLADLCEELTPSGLDCF